MSTDQQLRLQEAKKVSIYSYLKDIGITPCTDTGSSYIYVSPLRAESIPSFVVSKVKNHYKDFGNGSHGDLIDLVCQMEGKNIHQAIDSILRGKGTRNLSTFVEEKRTRKNVEIIAVEPLKSPWLWEYITERKISPQIASKYLVELSIKFPYGKCPERISKTIGFRNKEGGYEIRSRSMKISSSPKGITLFKGKDSNTVNVYEGFFSFFSHRGFAELNPLPNDVVVLNSVSFVANFCLMYDKNTFVNGYMDNDSAGNKATIVLMENFPRFQDCRNAYYGYCDWNDKACGKPLKKRKTGFIHEIFEKDLEISK